MSSPTSPTHGKLGAIYRLRPNGFKGDGLNDVTWGLAFSGSASAHYEVVIDAEATPDTFKWRKNGGPWTATVAITGAAQTLDDGQTITFAATTGHTLADQWIIGNFKDEACTESGVEAQITNAPSVAVITGAGLDDLTSGGAFTGTGVINFKAEIDAEGTPDTFKWSDTGGATWNAEGVAITGAAQTLSNGVTITFAATTGHTLADYWTFAALNKRILNPNASPTFTDTGGENALIVDHVRGKATFSDNVTVVDVDGNNGFIPLSALEKVGYLIDWNFTATGDMSAMDYMGEHWKHVLPGQAGGSGGANAFFIADKTFFEAIEDNIDGTQAYHFLELYNYDPDKDQTGDHFNGWVTFNSFGVNAPIGEIVKEAVGFQLHGIPMFTENV